MGQELRSSLLDLHTLKDVTEPGREARVDLGSCQGRWMPRRRTGRCGAEVTDVPRLPWRMQ